jgi:hypothetical protein
MYFKLKFRIMHEELVGLLGKEFIERLLSKPMPQSFRSPGFFIQEKNARICWNRYKYGALEERFESPEEQQDYYYQQTSLYLSSILN